MKMYTTRLYIGLSDSVTKRQKISTPQARYVILDILRDFNIRESTMYLATGTWEYEDGDVCEESTWIVEVWHTTPLDFTPITRSIKDALNQESVGVSTAECNIEFM